MVRYVLQIETRRMGTSFSFSVSDSRERLALAERVLARMDQLVADLEQELSEFIAGSSVSVFNRSALGEEIRLTPAFFALLKASARIAEQTGYAFDPSFRSGSGTDLRDRVLLDPVRRTARKLRADAHLSFGAIGKGFALDEARKLLDAENFSNYRLNAGGSSIVLSGTLDVDTPWPLSWAWKKDATGALQGQSLKFRSAGSACIGVSGNLEKGEHIVGSHRNTLLSSWVSCESAADADALSTALHSLGWDAGFPLVADSLRRTAVGAIDLREIPHWNTHFQNQFGAIQADLSDPRSGNAEADNRLERKAVV